MNFLLIIFLSSLFEILLFQAIQCSSVKVDENNLILTKNGYIKGFNDSYASMYLGIPFAQAPVGELRWKEPLNVQSWSPNVLNASRFKPACPQLNCTKKIPALVCPTEVMKITEILKYFFSKSIKLIVYTLNE